jgi:hypothetical protein
VFPLRVVTESPHKIGVVIRDLTKEVAMMTFDGLIRKVNIDLVLQKKIPSLLDPG